MNRMTSTMLSQLHTWIKEDKVIKFYSTYAWKKIRKEVLKRDHFECQECKRVGKYSKGEVVHHIEELRQKPLRALDMTNLETVCASCHNKIHPEKLQTENSLKNSFTNTERW